MNDKSETFKEKPTTIIARIQSNNWFKKEGDRESAPTTKPLDTPEHIKKANLG